MEENQATPTKKPMSKTEVFSHLAETTGLTKQQIQEVFDALGKLIEQNLGEHGPGAFIVPNLLQIKVTRKPAVEAHMGINPFTKQEMMFKAKPVKSAVKLVALKALKDMVSKKQVL